MQISFHRDNRRRLYDRLPEGALLLITSGTAPRHTNDQYYPFLANRNFVYLTGCEREGFYFAALKTEHTVEETLFILPPDDHAEKWGGRRLKLHEVTAAHGIEKAAYVDTLDTFLYRVLNSGSVKSLHLDLFRHTPQEPLGWAGQLADRIRREFPHIAICDILNDMRALRSVKAPCEIEAMRIAETGTKAGIEAMMRVVRPGLKEYHLKAAFDHALTTLNMPEPHSPPIICSGPNNFYIHYNFGFQGDVCDGDLILNDVGARYDNVGTDVSRAYPVNAKFSDMQKKLYHCAYEVSELMFETIAPGMPHADVDRIIRQETAKRLVKIGVLDRVENVGRYMWHGGSHHVGYDVHDVVTPGGLLVPGMVFCVDIGIYAEELGIGFRLEDNCLVTETGCENLSAAIPRSIEEIESFMANR